MKESCSVPSALRFGVFELDPKAGELRKKGMKVKLQGQPIDILVLLLQRPGEIVTREELQKNLWPADTFCGLRAGPEQCHEEAAGGVGRRRRESPLY